MEEFVVSGYINYCIAVLGIVGIIFRVITSIIVRNMIRESENIPASKLNLLKQMRLKFENCYRLNLGVNNVHTFVDKYIYKYKICGISLHGMERMTLLCAWLTAVIGLSSGVLCIYRKSTEIGIQCFFYGIGTSLILCTFHFIFDIGYEKIIFRANMQDFFENSLVSRLAHEYSMGSKEIIQTEKETLYESPELQTVIAREDNRSDIKNTLSSEKRKPKREEKKAQQSHNAEIIEEVISQYLP